MSLNPCEIKELLERYFRNELNEIELDLLFEILAVDHSDNLLQAFLDEKLGSLPEDKKGIPEEVSSTIIRNISQGALFTDQSISSSYLNSYSSRILKIGRYVVAASLLFVVAFIVMNMLFDNTYRFKTLIPKADYIHFKNITSTPFVILLPDSSRVVLEPNASIHYPRKFKAFERDVYLQGDAFFQVTKNSRKPFMVYSGSIITKVLGTSFFIRNKVKKGIEVEVISGKVKVFENSRMTGSEKNQHVLLQPNQKVVFDPNENIFQTSIPDKPVLLKLKNDEMVLNMEPVLFKYKESKLKDILRDLERNYAIDIVIGNEELNNCLFTGDITDQDLFAKLKIICLTLGADYEISESKILITGTGCN